MRTQDFDFYLPDALIAQHPTKTRGASRLLTLDGKTGLTQDAMFADLLNLLNAGDLLILNDTRVIKARLLGEKVTGGKIEVMIERVVDAHHALAQIKASRAPQVGSKLLINNKIIAGAKIQAEVIARQDDLFMLRFTDSTDVMAILDQHGSLPLPPYITHLADAEDEQRLSLIHI